MVPWNYGLVNAFPDHPLLENPKVASDDTSSLSLPVSSSAPSPIPPDPFPFFRLPSELRNRVYTLLLFTNPPYRMDDDLRPGPCTSLFLVSRRFHAEASYILYTTQTFRLFPLQEFKSLPTVRELPTHYRALLTTVELVLGESWTAPPASWTVNKSMARCLASMDSVQTLRVFVEIDPSHPVFAKFRVSHGFYTQFSGNLLSDILDAMPQLEIVQIDGRPSVQLDGPLVSRLRQEVEAQGRIIKLGGLYHKDVADDSDSTKQKHHGGTSNNGRQKKK